MAGKLFSVRNSFYLGNFQTCINEAQREKTPSLEKDLFMYRSYICLKKYGLVMDELKNKTDIELVALRQLANYSNGDSKTRTRIVEELESNPPVYSEEGKIVHLIASAQIAMSEEKLDTALRILSGAVGLEIHALTLQIYLKLDRIDLARKELKKMQEKDEDSTLTQLATASVNLCHGLGKDKLEESYYIFHDLSDKYGSSPLLLNGQVSALIAQHKFDAAEPLLHEALEKDSDNPETLINLMVLSSILGRGQDVVNRYLNQLKDGNSKHPFVVDMERKEAILDKLIKSQSVH